MAWPAPAFKGLIAHTDVSTYGNAFNGSAQTDPIALTAYSSASNYLLSLKNAGSGGKALTVLDSAGVTRATWSDSGLSINIGHATNAALTLKNTNSSGPALAIQNAAGTQSIWSRDKQMIWGQALDTVGLLNIANATPTSGERVGLITLQCYTATAGAESQFNYGINCQTIQNVNASSAYTTLGIESNVLVYNLSVQEAASFFGTATLNNGSGGSSKAFYAYDSSITHVGEKHNAYNFEAIQINQGANTANRYMGAFRVVAGQGIIDGIIRTDATSGTIATAFDFSHYVPALIFDMGSSANPLTVQAIGGVKTLAALPGASTQRVFSAYALNGTTEYLKASLGTAGEAYFGTVQNQSLTFITNDAVKAILSTAGDFTARRYKANGTTITSTEIVASAGFGATRAVSAVLGTDAAFSFTVTAQGGTYGASPTITCTFKDGTYTTAPIVTVVRNGGSQPTIDCSWTVSATAITITLNTTPVGGETYPFAVHVIG